MPITMPITLAESRAPDQLKNVKVLYVASKDGRTKAKVDLSNLSKIVDATLANKGIVQLQTTINDAEDKAATPKAVNTVKKIADANTQKITEIENSINEALPGDGSLADKLKNVAFTTKDNNFTESQTIVSKDAAGTNSGNLKFKSTKVDATNGNLDAGTSKVTAGTLVTDKNNKQIGHATVTVQESGRDAEFGLSDKDGQLHGIKVHLNKAGDASSIVAFAPDTPAGATAQEIATAKFVKDSMQHVEENLVDATNEKRGLVKLLDTPDESKDAATGKTAATPKAVFTVDAKVGKLTKVVGENAENAALVNKENTFTKNQAIVASQVEDAPAGEDPESQPAKIGERAAVNLKLGQYKHNDGTFADGKTTAAHAAITVTSQDNKEVGAVKFDTTAQNATAELGVKKPDGTASGSVKVTFERSSGKFKAEAPTTADGATGNEIAVASWVNKKVAGVQDSIVDATDTKRGLVTLSDAINGTENAATGKKAATPLAVKTVQDNLGKVTAKVGVNGEHAALLNADNVFTKTNTRVINLTPEETTTGQIIAYTHKYADLNAESTNPSKMVFSGVLATDQNDKKLYGSFGTVDTDGNRSQAMKVFKKTGDLAGMAELKTNADGTSVKFTVPELKGDETGTEAATAKFVVDKIAALNGENIAYTNKANVFTKDQTVTATVSGSNEAGNIGIKSTKFDTKTGGLDGVTEVKDSFNAVDKNNVTYGTVEFGVKNSEGRHASLALRDVTGANKGITVTLDAAGTVGSLKATAPIPGSDAANDQIAVVKTVKDAKAASDAALKKVTDVIGVSAEHAALVTKTNEFTKPQKIVSDDKILNLGGDGLAEEGAEDDALVLGSSFGDSKAEIIIAANGSITRTELPEDPDDLELATVGYVKSLGDIAGSMAAGSFAIALENYVEPAFQANMEEGVFHAVPQNAADQYIQIDPETGKPAEAQAPGVNDKKVDHFVIMYKAPTSKVVMNLGERKVAPDFNDVPLLSKDNNFAGTNTFKDAQKANPSVNPDLSDVNDKSYITKSELVAYFNKNAPWNNIITEEPNPEDILPGQCYFLIEEEE